MTGKFLVILLMSCSLFAQAPNFEPETLDANDASPSISTEEAMKAYKTGQYEKALQHLRELFKAEPETTSDTLRVFFDALTETGNYDEAVAVCKDYTTKHPGDAVALTLLGEAHSQVGAYDEAISAFKGALNVAPESGSAKLGLGFLYENLGKTDDSLPLLNQVCESFYKNNPKDEDSLVVCGLAFKEINRPHQALNLFVKASRIGDGTAGRLATGFLFLDKGQVNDAAAEFRPVLLKNANHPIARLGMAGCYFHDGQFPKVEEELERILQVNPNLIEALEMQASLAIHSEDNEKAIELLQKALRINNKNLSVHTNLASVYYLQKDAKNYEKMKAKVESIHPRHAEFYRAIGDAAERLRKPETAMEFMKKAYELEPDNWKVLESFGFLLCREGNESKGYTVLEKSFQQNKFNRRVFNMLETLDYMEEFEVLEDKYFRIAVHKKKDGFLLPYAKRYLDDWRKTLLAQYETDLEHKIIIEMFPRHDYFAARVHGLPGIGLNGVCFGRVIAMDSPRVSPGQFNWKEVLVHEFSHAVTLHATKFNIPRWFTEGLAVYDERTRRTYNQDQMLVTAYKRGEIIRMEDLNRGFTRPKSQFQILLAYVQGKICIEYMVKTFGFPKILKLIRLLNEGTTFEDALKAELTMTQMQLSDAIHSYTTEVAKSLPLIPQYAPDDIERLSSLAGDQTDDADVQADYALALMMAGQNGPASVAVQKALDLEPKHALAVRVKGELAYGNGELDEAKRLLEKAIQLNPSPVGPYFRLALIAKTQDRKDDAVAHLREAAKRYSGFPPVYQQMESIANDTQNSALRRQALEGMLTLDSTAAHAGPLLMNSYSAEGRHEDVERVAYRLFELQPYLVGTHEVLAESLRALGKLQDAATEYLACTKIRPRKVSNYIKLAKLQIETDQKTEARKTLQLARRVDRRNEEIQKLLESLGEK